MFGLTNRVCGDTYPMGCQGSRAERKTHQRSWVGKVTRTGADPATGGRKDRILRGWQELRRRVTQKVSGRTSLEVLSWGTSCRFVRFEPGVWVVKQKDGIGVFALLLSSRPGRQREVTRCGPSFEWRVRREPTSSSKYVLTVVSAKATARVRCMRRSCMVRSAPRPNPESISGQARAAPALAPFTVRGLLLEGPAVPGKKWKHARTRQRGHLSRAETQ